MRIFRGFSEPEGGKEGPTVVFRKTYRGTRGVIFFLEHGMIPLDYSEEKITPRVSRQVFWKTTVSIRPALGLISV
jgi:hypothetical protein